jgi:predicted transcriptional regulator
VEQELCTHPGHLRLSPVFCGVRFYSVNIVLLFHHVWDFVVVSEVDLDIIILCTVSRYKTTEINKISKCYICQREEKLEYIKGVKRKHRLKNNNMTMAKRKMTKQ